ncbi:MBOAT family O-acyltransferase [Hypericibacter sp.]|uniref:MBOAT family O-acyltransferase n=1 Tax=Hypericibacter sp. TaxID=2705401 RepID=UPI003D6D86FE
MLFNSYGFLFAFLPITWIGHEILRRLELRTAALAWLAAASALFYASWNPRLLPVLLISILINYTVGGWLRRQAQHSGHGSKVLLTLGLIFNLGLLAYFKYANFLVDNVDRLAGFDLVLAKIVLPIGISFFTFQKIAYLIDSYKGIAKCGSLLEFLMFVLFFPQLIAGPIVHYSEIMPQLARSWPVPAADRLAVGLTILVIGLIKKVFIADTMAIPATSLFAAAAHGHDPALIESWIGTLSYAFQIYFDFSGYSDMAIGLAWMFGIRLPVNFASPYKADSIADFWQRWHVTLSRFLKAYLYIPLGGSRQGPTRNYLNLLVTMLLGGLWHGAAWTFVLWGLLHGVMIVVHRLWRRSAAMPRLHPGLARGLTLFCVVLAWVPFRAPDLQTALCVYRGLAGLNGILLPSALVASLDRLPGFGALLTAGPIDVDRPLSTALWILGLLAVVWFLPNTHQWLGSASPGLPSEGYPATALLPTPRFLQWRPNWLYGLSFAGGLFICVIKLNDVSPFIYFQF